MSCPGGEECISGEDGGAGSVSFSWLASGVVMSESGMVASDDGS
jgi:hypothetical protein